MSDAEHMVKIITEAKATAEKIFKAAHDLNEKHRQENEPVRELVSQASAALYYLTRALGSAQKAVKEEAQA